MTGKEKDFSLFDDFFAFVAEAGDALCAILEDEWFSVPDKGGTGGKRAFLSFVLRQKENMLIVAASATGVPAEEYRRTCTPTSLTDMVGAVLASPHVRDFFGLSGEDAPSSSPAPFPSSAEDCQPQPPLSL